MDRDADVIYVVNTYRAREESSVIHAAAIPPMGEENPCAWPHDGFQHDKGSGQQLAEQYRDHGLEMLDEHATHEQAATASRPASWRCGAHADGPAQVFRHLEDWMSEFRLYHRKDGKIVKERDDLMSATRYAIMMKRFAFA